MSIVTKSLGQLKGARGQIDIEWEIANFSSQSAEVNECHHSPKFFFCDSYWYLRVYPNGRKQNPSEGYIEVYLVREDSEPPVSVTFSIFLKKEDGLEELVSERKRRFAKKNNGWGEHRAILRSKVMDSFWEYMPSAILTVICSLKCDEVQEKTKKPAELVETTTQTQSQWCTEKLSHDLSELLLSGEDSDMTVRVEGTEFCLHRGIMGARTPVFCAMFRNEMKERETGIVRIDDCEAEVFRAFVRYLYSGRVDELTTGSMFGLFTLADKYQVDELKSACLEFVRSNLSVDTFCDVVCLALTYELNELLEQAAEYFAQKMEDILGNVKWMTYLTENPMQANELMLKAVQKNSAT